MVKCDDMECATTGHFNLEFTRHAVPLSECGQNLYKSISWEITIDLPEDSVFSQPKHYMHHPGADTHARHLGN